MMHTAHVNQMTLAVGRRIAAARVSRDLTQAQLARRMGTTQAAVGYAETGRRDMRLSSLVAYAIALQVEPGSLLPIDVKAYT